MDKVKEGMAFCRKHHFWILSGLAFVILSVMYMQASSKLNAEYTKDKNAAKTASAGLDPLTKGNHPNDAWVKQMEEQTHQMRVTNLRMAWEELYANQKAVFVWPPLLGNDFAEAFENPANVPEAKMGALCERYQNRVVAQLKDLVKSVDAEWTAEEGGAPGAGHGERPHMPAMPHGKGPIPGLPARGLPAAGTPEIEYPVVWSSSDQSRLVKDYNWQEAPSALDVRYAQEELWVMKAICDAIAKTNIDANNGNQPLGAYQAVVREIDAILAGYDAAGKSAGGNQQQSRLAVPIGQHRIIGPAAPMTPPGMGPGGPGGAPDQPFDVKRPDREKKENQLGGGPGFGPGFGRGPPGMAGPGGQGGMPGGMPGAAAEPAGPDDWLNNGRYVDGNGKPLRASEKAPFEEYNLMAFRINVAADEQKWPALLVELCRSKLPLEIREVRLNASSSEGGGGGPGGPGGEGLHGPRGQGPAGADSGFLRNVNIEIVGVVYLLNPVSKELKPDTAAGADAAANPAPATPTPATPAPVNPAPAGPPASPAAAGTAPAPTAPAGAPATGTPTSPAPAGGAPAVSAPATGAVPPAGTTPPAATTPPSASPAAPVPANPKSPAPPAATPAPAAGAPAAPAK